MRILSAVATVTLMLSTTPAQGAVIGLRGGDSGSPPATDGSWFDMVTCGADDLAGYFCFTYDNPFFHAPVEGLVVTDHGFLLSLDFQFRDASGQLIPSTHWSLAPQSEWQLLTPVDQFVVRMCESTPQGPQACATESSSVLFLLVFMGDPVFTVFSDDARSLQITAVNLIPNQSDEVPEPSTLLLLGLGAATAAGRRVRRRPSGRM